MALAPEPVLKKARLSPRYVEKYKDVCREAALRTALMEVGLADDVASIVCDYAEATEAEAANSYGREVWWQDFAKELSHLRARMWETASEACHIFVVDPDRYPYCFNSWKKAEKLTGLHFSTFRNQRGKHVYLASFQPLDQQATYEMPGLEGARLTFHQLGLFR